MQAWDKAQNHTMLMLKVVDAEELLMLCECFVYVQNFKILFHSKLELSLLVEFSAEESFYRDP